MGKYFYKILFVMGITTLFISQGMFSKLLKFKPAIKKAIIRGAIGGTASTFLDEYCERKIIKHELAGHALEALKIGIVPEKATSTPRLVGTHGLTYINSLEHNLLSELYPEKIIKYYNAGYILQNIPYVDIAKLSDEQRDLVYISQGGLTSDTKRAYDLSKKVALRLLAFKKGKNLIAENAEDINDLLYRTIEQEYQFEKELQQDAHAMRDLNDATSFVYKTLWEETKKDTEEPEYQQLVPRVSAALRSAPLKPERSIFDFEPLLTRTLLREEILKEVEGSRFHPKHPEFRPLVDEPFVRSHFVDPDKVLAHLQKNYR